MCYYYKIPYKFQVQLSDGKLSAGRGVLKTPGAKQRASRHMRDYRVALYKQLGVKAVVREDGRVQWFGCKRESQVQLRNKYFL